MMSTNNNKQNNNQVENLLNSVSKQLGTSPEELKSAAQTNNFSNVFENLNPKDAHNLQKVLSDKDAADKLLATPQAQQLLKILLGEK